MVAYDICMHKSCLGYVHDDSFKIMIPKNAAEKCVVFVLAGIVWEVNNANKQAIEFTPED